MIREKMFRLHRHKSSTKSGERIDFNFSNIQALQVPKGWDRLYVSLLSTETGKTISKSGKASVRNGTCQWTDTLSESIFISEDEASKEIQQYFFKLVVLMGSARSSILGEATINLAGYMTSRASVPLSLPLKKCNHGTILQVEIQCLTPRMKHRDEKWNHTNSYAEDTNSDYDDADNKSEMSDSTFTKSAGSSSSNHLDGAFHPGDLGSRETSFSASGPRYSFDSMEGSIGRESFSPQSNSSGVVKHVTGRQDSGSGRYPQNQREDCGKISHATISSPLQNAGSSRNFLETEAITIEELRAEARMWERNARKLMLDHELLMKEFSDQSKQLANHDVELSASRTECDGLRQEIEYLKVLLEKQKATENLKFQPTEMDNIHKVLEDELKFHKESNHDLALQLKKTQDSNLELVSILQELEETIETQKKEIEKLATLKSKVEDGGKKSSFGHEDNGEVNPNEEVSWEKIRKASCDSDLEGSTVEHPITDLHAEFGQEDNRNLELQLQQLRESQKILESTILYLEKTLEDKNHEIITERDFRTRALQDCEAEWRCKLTSKEEEVMNLEAKLSKALSDANSEVQQFENRGDVDLIKEIEALKEKVEELERDCNELTDENLELLHKLKEATKNLPTNRVSSKSSCNVYPANNSPLASEPEVGKFKYQICQFEEEIKNEVFPTEGVATDHLQIPFVDIECADTELQSQAFKDKACCVELQNSHLKEEERGIQITTLPRQLEFCRGEKTGSKHHPADVQTKFENTESRTAIDKFNLLPALLEQLQLLIVNVKKQRHTLSPSVDSKYPNAVNILCSHNCAEQTTQKDLEEAVLDNLVQLNELFEAKTTPCEDDLPCSETVIRSTIANRVENKLEGDNLKNYSRCAHCQGINRSNKKLESTVADLSKELLAKTSQIEELNADRLLKEEEIEASRRRQRELETQISGHRKIEEQMEEYMEIMKRESSVTSKCLDSLKNDLTVQNSGMESHISDKKVLERKSLELESTKCELEFHLSELEEENVRQSERISGLEAQLRYLTDAREASRLELQHSESHVMNLQDDIRRLEGEMEAHKLSMKQKTEDIQKRWLEAQEECEYLKKANPKLQATAEDLIEECSSLQKSSRELRQQKIELQEHCTVLEVELKDSRSRFADCSNKIEDLEAKLSAILEEMNSKEKILNSELDALHQRSKEYEKLVHEEGLFNQTNLEKAVEVENLQQEVPDLTGQQKFEIIQMDYETKILALTTELTASKENHETLVTNHEKLLGLLEDVRCNEEKLKGTIDKLESNLKSSVHERLQLKEEISCLKTQLQKIPPLQDEVLALKGSLYGTKFENERLQTSLEMLSADYEEVKTQRISLLQKTSSMQKATSELENCRRSKVALEEKVLRLEGDLTASEALSSQDVELKNELGRIKRVNSQFQWKIKRLEEEKEEWLQRAQALEEELKQKKEVNQDQFGSSCNRIVADHRSSGTDTSIDREWKHSEKNEEDDIVQTCKDQSEPCMKTDQLQQFLEDREMVRHQRQDSSEIHRNTSSSLNIAVDTAPRIKSLENELAEALEANEMYKAQIKSFLSEGQTCHSDACEELEVDNQPIKREENNQKAALLEAELREIRERYLEMSLKYAEVEAQREQLVMKLKTVNSGKRWFS